MKKYLLITALCLVAFTGFSQSTFSILSYTLPDGWYARQGGENTELGKKGTESANCRIVFFKPVKIVVEDVTTYYQYRDALLGNPGPGIASSSKPQKEYGPGWTSFSGSQNWGTKGNISSIAFYSVSDTRQTVFFAVYSTSDESCINELDAIIQSVNLTELSAAQAGDKTKAARKRIRLLPLRSLKPMVN